MTALSHLIAELRRLHQEASAGPWHHVIGTICNPVARNKVRWSGGITSPDGVIVDNDEALHAVTPLQKKTLEANMHAIALLRNLAPNLADMLETAERALKAVAAMPYYTPAEFSRAQATTTAAIAELERLAGQPLSK